MKSLWIGGLFVLVITGTAWGQDIGQQQEISGPNLPSPFHDSSSSELGVKIDRLSVKDGDRFREGQVLVTMECSVQRASLEKANAALTAAERTASVNRKLHEMNAGGSLEADVTAAEARKARSEVEAGRAILSKCQVTAPFSGRVADLKVREQQFVQPGTQMMEIIDDFVLEIEFLAPSRWLSWLKVGTAFQITVDETGSSYPARVARLGARVDPVSQSIKVVGEIVGTHAELLSGMSGKIQIAPPQTTEKTAPVARP